MQLIRDVDQFAALVRSARSSGQPIVTNCYLFPDEINTCIAKNSLFWKAAAAGIYVLREEEAFYRLYFYGPIQSRADFTELDKPVVLELVYQESSKPSPVVEQVSRWETCGFAVYHTYRRMVLIGTRVGQPQPASSPQGAPAYRTSRARPADLESIRGLWMNVLDRLSTAIPARDDLARLIARKQILCVLDGRESVVAVLQVQHAGSVCTIHHVAVDPAHRRRGLANHLMQYGIDQGRCLGVRKYVLWVADDNAPARQLYRSLGYEYDGRVTVQLLFSKVREEKDGWKT